MACSTTVPPAACGSATRDSIGAEITDMGEQDYRHGLRTSELVAEIRGLLATERRAERLVCRYLADLSDRIQARQEAELGVYADELEAARYFFGLGARETRERVRVGRALRQLPRIEHAFVHGELCYSRVREVTRVATTQTETGWLELARRLEMRSLEQRVTAERAAAGAKSDRHGERRLEHPARTQWMGPDRVRVTFELSTGAWAVLERAMREARGAGAAGASDGDALEAVARAALSVPRAGTSDVGDLGPFRWSSGGNSEGLADAAEPGRPSAEVRGPGVATGGDRASVEATQGESVAELGVEATQGGSAVECDLEATQGGSAVECDLEATHVGAAGERGPKRRIDEWAGTGPVEQAREPAARLMQVMGRSSGWTLDALTELSGLSVHETCVALTLLELAGRVRRRAFAFDPV